MFIMVIFWTEQKPDISISILTDDLRMSIGASPSGAAGNRTPEQKCQVSIRNHYQPHLLKRITFRC